MNRLEILIKGVLMTDSNVFIDMLNCFAEEGAFSFTRKAKRLRVETNSSGGNISKWIRFKTNGAYTSILDVRGGRQRLFVNFNPSTVLRDSCHRNEGKVGDLKRALSIVKQWLRNDGIKVDCLEECKISRLDLARDIDSSYPYETYIPLLDYIDGSYLKRVRFVDSYSFKNKGLDFTVYNKTAEIQAKGAE